MMEVIQDAATLLKLLKEERKARKEAEELAKQKEAELNALKQKFTSSSQSGADDSITSQSEFQSEYPDPILRVDQEGNLLYVNTVGKQLFDSVSQARKPALKRLFLNKASIA